MIEIGRELIIKASEGDMNSFEEIYRLSSGFVYNIALRIANNAKDAEEITQEVFIKVFKNLKSFSFRASFNTWVYRIAVNAAINFKKRASKEENKRVDYESRLNTELVDKGKDHASESLVKFLLSNLSPEHRACIVLREMEGLSYEEISNVLRININTVRSRLKRARQKLVTLRKEVVRNEL
ncbi:MAG: sigma-70 family RNA polymerase sigma factor [Candidatus Omnitrophica bacterium]|nr:sigma-70 family RNA polymerase sigma factor [Candidatus Omnitrophota bacterium]MBU1852568.1 sigma-70 family RNA polymerase sigma factor [Candidatus Omnitrophota bacterium]